MGEDIERKIKIAQLKKSSKILIVRLLILFILCAFGGFIFRWAEGTLELEYKCGVKKVQRDFIDTLWTGSRLMKEDDWKSLARKRLMRFEEELHSAYSEGMDADSGSKTWNFANAMFYSMTLLTTIGYGHISPVTFTGKLLTLVYSFIGIPVFSIIMADAGKVLTLTLKLQLTKAKEKRRDYSIDDQFNFPVTVALVLVLIYGAVGAIFFYLWEEEWGLFGSLYFVFVTFSTVGLGDLVPSNPIVAIMTSLYFMFGLALTALVIGLIQERIERPLNMITRRTAFLLGLTQPRPRLKAGSESDLAEEYGILLKSD